jgi:branched-chain amino acid transport system substrate-binding protein
MKIDSLRQVRRVGLTCLIALALTSPFHMTAAAADPLKIGVLTDLTGPYSDASGPGSVTAAELALQDFGAPTVNGQKIEIISADTQNKPDVAAAIARRWFDREGVSMIVDLPVTPVAFAVQTIAAQAKKAVMITASAASELYTKSCSLLSTHWADDTHALAAGTAARLMASGPSKWFFISVDISFGAALQREATQVIESKGGTVVGSVRHPTNNADFSSQLLQAQASGARYIGITSVGGDLVTLLKQAKEFGVGQDGKQSLVGFLVYITDINSLGLKAAEGLNVSSGFYWDQSESSRAFAKRFFAKQNTMPTKDQAEVYIAVRQYLKAAAAAKSNDPVAINQQMRQMPFDYFGTPASIRADGRVLYDMGLYRVKSEAASKYPWDYYERIATIPQSEAFASPNPTCINEATGKN